MQDPEQKINGQDYPSIVARIVEDLNLAPLQVKETVDMLLGGSTVHFIARYRKERTRGLDESSIRQIGERLEYYSELDERRQTILRTIEEQGRLTETLRKQIAECRGKQRLEDLYLPFKPKRRTRASIAREKGLDRLADVISRQSGIGKSKEEIVLPFVDPKKDVKNFEEAVSGALDIIAEDIADSADIRAGMRRYYLSKGRMEVHAQKDWEGKTSKFEDYYKYSEPFKKVPPHRMLAIRRGAREKILVWKIDVEEPLAVKWLESKAVQGRDLLFDSDLRKAVKDSYRRLLSPAAASEVFISRMEEADREAISVFTRNLRNLLMFPPAGHKIIMGVDPGFATGCKTAVIDRNGDFLEYQQIFPTPPRKQTQEAEAVVTRLIRKHNVEVVAVGNGTASKETSAFIRDTIRNNGLAVFSLVVSEAGASVYSASNAAIREFPDLDVTVRGAVSIARRVQDPLSELVKIDPKSIGVGQYQHDVNQAELRKGMSFVVESCVNAVGVDVNTASLELLSYVSGIGPVLAQNIVEHRSRRGSFEDKLALLEVPRLGEKAFEQCAGFLRIYGGKNSLDNSAIHPESYPVAERMARDLDMDIAGLIGREEIVRKIDLTRYTDENCGLPTLQDIARELVKPGVDPRKDFESIRFSPDVNRLEDLAVDMELSGIVTNVTNFGAFVDIGVHQDGLIHVSKLSEHFVREPHDVVAVGDIVKVKVLSVDNDKSRIGLRLVAKEAA